MGRLIDAVSLIGNMMDAIHDGYNAEDMLSIVNEAPTIDAVPREELFDLFTEITAAEYGKQRFFMQKDGTVYDRHKGDYLHNFDLAVVRFCNELSGW